MPIMYDNLISICKILTKFVFQIMKLGYLGLLTPWHFFGLFRVSEMAWASPCNLISLCIYQIYSFTEQDSSFCRYVNERANTIKNVILMIGSDQACPVLTLKLYLNLKPLNSIYRFCHQNMTPMTRNQFEAVLNKAILFIKLPTANFKSRSFRIGAGKHVKGGYHQVIQKNG